LEDRVTPAGMTFVVTDTTDASANSLRAAITASNANNPGAAMFNTIDFNISAAGAVQTISLLSALPAITEPVLINGYSEVGASPNTLVNADNAKILIQIDGTNAGTAVDGLTLGAGSGGSTIKGVDITNFHADASFNGGVGILVQSNGNSILGDFVGVNAAGTAQMPNGSDGLRVVDASNNMIGATNLADRNIASGNILDGIHVEGTLTTPATGNLIQGNFVGVAANGVSSVGVRTVPIPNAGALGTKSGNFLFGIEISGGKSNAVGGSVTGARNVVGFNSGGIEVDNGGQSNAIQGNFSGVGADGVTPVANLFLGITLRSSNGFSIPLGPAQPNEPGVSTNLVGGTAAGDGNLVEFNGTGGIAVFGNPVSASGQPNIGNAIEGNSIFQNGGSFETASSAPTALVGIDLTNGFLFPRDDGPTPNDSKGHGAPNDPNNFQNFPVLTTAFEDGAGHTDITGTLTMATEPNTTFRIEFFANAPDPLNLPAEGQQYIGFVTATTNASGNASFSVSLNVTVPSNHVITATATDPNGNTSEFGAALQFSDTPLSNGLRQVSGGIPAGAQPTSMVHAVDGNFWFTEFGGNAIGRITPAGVVSQFSLASLGADTGPLDLVSDSANGFLYFTENNTGVIGRINPMAGSDAAILASETQSAIVPSGAGAGVHGITVGPDGNLWFAETRVDRIANVNPSLSTINEFSTGITAGAAPVNIVAGPDGALWFTESHNASTGAIGRITTAGVVTNEFLVPGFENNNDPQDITVGPDGALWFTEAGTDVIGRITTTGAIQPFALPAGSDPQGITSGPFGLLYFAESGSGLIGSITTAGVFTQLGAGQIASGSQPTDIASGGTNALWFTEVGNNGNTIGELAGLSAQERAVQELYIDALGRAGSVAELAGWASLLPAGATSLTPAVASGIENSPEARDRLVKGWYVAYLGRPALGGEEQGFVNELLGGMSEEQVLSQILGSAEFFHRAQSLIGGGDANSNFVQGLYDLVLGRTGSAAEVAGWDNLLRSGALTSQATALDFLGSPEYRADVVTGYYTRLLRRSTSTVGQAEISAWVNSGLGEFQIRLGFESSAEFFSNG
jgi:streptogramin lyase